jgi:hypothetical protein
MKLIAATQLGKSDVAFESPVPAQRAKPFAAWRLLNREA